jgi:hypothetical protein
MHDSACMPGNLRGIIRTMVGNDMNGKEIGRIIYGEQATYCGSDYASFIVSRDYDHETG